MSLEVKTSRDDKISQIEYPLISIITPCLNRVRYIQEAVESVLRQNYPRFEHIIVDGCSTDGTLEVLRGYPHLRVISEPDRGIYDAVNKGIRLAKGDIIGWLNSDDLYEENIFHKVAKGFLDDPGIDVVIGNALIFKEEHKGKRQIVKTKRQFENGSISFAPSQRASLSPNACFFHRRVYQKFGVYDPQYRISGDREFFIRLSQQEIKGAHLGQVTCYYRMHVGSLTFIARKYATRRDMSTSSPLMKHLKENIAICEFYLNKDGVSNDVIQYCKGLHSRFSANIVYRSLRCGRFNELIKYMHQGWRFNRRWPLVFVAFIAHKFSYVISYLLRSIRTNLARAVYCAKADAR